MFRGVARTRNRGCLLPVLLTATIAPPPLPRLVALDPNQRWAQYRLALEYWMDQTRATRLVFCENSGYGVNYTPLIMRASSLSKQLEVISFNGNHEAHLKGRGYGEGEIIRYALHNSRLIASASGFFKVTGRLVVQNFDLLEYLTRSRPVVMSERSAWRKGWVDTRFYKMDKAFYLRHLQDVHLNADRPDWILGKAYAAAVGTLGLPPFPVAMRIHGVSGNGVPYDEAFWRYMAKSVLAGAGYYRVKTAE